ncbi:integrase family protein [Acidiphilium cryptum]|uniref:Phage integrase family protein n=1 Tax=Acidiphilium cryptum (strain JF-5) TaxID=349163 RepID=A5FWP7_ACICJ|nr:integrase family protein [Acidiphilium cryptum]ABQ30029.1 hypothetical protein Acry_0810 [Acidiphilium cryptum JF-5]
MKPAEPNDLVAYGSEKSTMFSVIDSSYKGTEYNLSTTQILIRENALKHLDVAREIYYQYRQKTQFSENQWKDSRRKNLRLRYLNHSMDPNMLDYYPDTWLSFSKVLNSTGIDYFFNETVYSLLYKKNNINEITEGIYAAIFNTRTQKSDRTPIAAFTALYCLHAAGCILLPVGWISSYGGIRLAWQGSPETLSLLLDPPESLYRDNVRSELEGAWTVLGVDASKGTNHKRQLRAYRNLKLLLLAVPPGTSIGSVSGRMFIDAVRVIADMRDKLVEIQTTGRDRNVSNLRLIWNAIQPYRVRYPEANAETKEVRDFVTSHVFHRGIDAQHNLNLKRRGHQIRKEGDLRWVLDEAPYLADIVELGREYIQSGTAYITATLARGFEKLFEYLIDRPDEINYLTSLSRDDIAAGSTCCKDNGGFPSYIDYLRTSQDIHRNQNKGSNKGERSDDRMNQILSSTYSFLEWYRDNKDQYFNVPLYRTDIPGQTRRGWNSGKTTKLPVPVRVLNLCREILTANDYEWPRSITDDHVVVTKRDGRSISEWCPVRCIALYLLFSIPIRAMSLRRLDSGEGDEFIFDRESESWTKNKLNTAEAGRSVGVIHRIIDSDLNGASLAGLFINSNKTRHPQRRVRRGRGPNLGAFDFGYVIPWNNLELFKHIAYCRDWQIENNPVSSPRGLDTVSDTSMRVTPTIAKDLPGFYFLFRDPTLRNEPISSHKLGVLFARVLEEAGRRLSIEDGAKISLDNLFTLHSLRVGGITAFMKAGVPLGVLTEFIAGHSTVIMNLYYQKFSAPELDKIISDAAAKLQAGSQIEADLLDRISRIREDIAADSNGMLVGQGLVFNDRQALETLRNSQAGLAMVDIDGCCPVGGSMCDVGGPLVGLDAYSPNILGSFGCPTCRFHITGEPFLPGMVIKANEVVYKLRAHAEAIRDVEQQIADAKTNSKAGPLRVLRSRLDGLNLATENLLVEWSARVQEILLSTGQLVNKKSNRTLEGKELRLHAKPTAAFEQGSEFKVTELLSRAADIVQLSPNVADQVKLRRRIFLDRLLGASGISPFLFSLDKDLANKTGTMLVNFLVNAIGWEGLDAAVSNQSSLLEIGFTIEQLKSLRKLCDPNGLLDFS